MEVVYVVGTGSPNLPLVEGQVIMYDYFFGHPLLPAKFKLYQVVMYDSSLGHPLLPAKFELSIFKPIDERCIVWPFSS